jgi:two-component system, NtrC family, sensor kinase
VKGDYLAVVKALLLCLSLLMTVSGAVAQKKQRQALIDSLLAELPKAKKDTNEVKLLITLSNAVGSADPLKGIQYGRLGLELAGELHWQKGEAFCHACIARNSFLRADYSTALEHRLHALDGFTALHDSVRMGTSMNMAGLIYQKTGRQREALDYFNKALEIAEAMDDPKTAGSIIGNLGALYSDQKK